MKLLLNLATIVLVACGVLVALFALSAPPTTRDIDADIARVREQITKAEADSGLYVSGLVKTLVDARLQVLKTNEAFLQMKRDALLRRIDLRYTVEGKAVAADPSHIASIERDIADTGTKLAESEAEANRYTGGVVRSLALVQAATYGLTLAQLNLSLMAERHGLLIQMPDGEAESGPDQPVGQTVVNKDGDAL